MATAWWSDFIVYLHTRSIWRWLWWWCIMGMV